MDWEDLKPPRPYRKKPRPHSFEWYGQRLDRIQFTENPLTTSMNRFLPAAIAALVALLLAPTSSLLAKDATKTRHIALIAGRPSHPSGMHEFRAGCLLFQKALAGVPNLEVQVYSNGWPTKVEGGKTVDDNAALERVDALLIYADGGGGHPAIKPERMAFIDRLSSRGAGLGFAHYGVEVPAGDPGDAMIRWIGGHYEHQYSINPMWSPKFTTFPNHPVSRGVKPFSTRDEWYVNMRWSENGRPVTWLLEDAPSDAVRKGPYVYPPGPYAHIVAASGRREAMMWVHERIDGGRGMGFTGGHTHKNWGDPNQRKIFLNALLWLAQMEVPAGGVESSITEADLAGNLDPKK